MEADVRFGVTGHRILPPSIVDRAVRHWSRVLPAGALLHGVSNLSDGADQLFATHVLAAGGTLEVVLACEGYAATLIADDSRSRFEHLRRAAAKGATMPYPQPRDQAFLAAGPALVGRGDPLFALWGRRPPPRRGR